MLKYYTFALALLLSACEQNNDEMKLQMDPLAFDVMHEGKQVKLFTLKNSKGMVAQITNYGAKIVSIIVPDKEGIFADVCLGYESAKEYINGIASLGATMGRVTNRIANAQFTLNDSIYHLAKNNGEHTIHGGAKGFRFQVWDYEQIDDKSVELSYFSADGEEGFPGNLQVKVRFAVTEENELKLTYRATTDKTTLINFTNHAFFNLAGEGNGNVLDHELLVKASRYTPVNETAIPTGEFAEVSGTPLDFASMTRIGDRINEAFDQLKYVGGYDHNYVIDKNDGDMGLAAILYEPNSGRVMEVRTTEPGIQVYTANSLTDNEKGKGGKTYGSRSSICLETQHYPDSPNHPNFPSTILNPGEQYISTTIYKFSTK